MVRPLTLALILWGAWCAPGSRTLGQVAAVPGPSALKVGDWPTERINMLDGPPHLGYIESEDDVWVNVIQVRRVKGQSMYLVIEPIDRAKIASVARLSDQQRAQLRERIEQFIHRARIETGRMEAVRLSTVARDGTQYHCYGGKWFSLESTVEEPVTRRIIVRVEQIFTAYRQILAPRADPQRPLRLVVLGSRADYRAYLARLGIGIENPACFLQEQNLVVANSDIARFGAELAKVKAQHARLDNELKQLEKQMPLRLAEVARQMQADGLPQDQILKALRNKRREFEDEIAKKRNDLLRVNRDNERKFQSITGQMFSRLYHEAFHAYVENYVYPGGSHAVPLWLSEGLAQIFEAGLLEAETLRIDAPHREALKRLKADLAGSQPLPLEKLLAADQQAFLTGGGANRFYVYSWGLAYYLTFEKNILGSPALDKYVEPPAPSVSPVQRFEKLVGVPMVKFEQQWRAYILNLR